MRNPGYLRRPASWPFLPSLSPSSLLTPFLPPSLAPLWLRTHLRKQSRAGQVHPARGQAVGEGRRLVAAFCLAVRGQGDGPQTLEPVTAACSGCHVAMTGIVATWWMGFLRSLQPTEARGLYLDLILCSLCELMFVFLPAGHILAMGPLLSLGLHLCSTSLPLKRGCQDCSLGNVIRLPWCLWGI